MRTAVNNTKIIKQANTHLVLAALHKNQALSVEDIVSITRLSRPTVLNLLKELDSRELVSRAGMGESMGGRQPVLYALNLSKYFSVGIDLEYPPVRVVFSDLKEKILFTQTWENSAQDTVRDIENNLADAIREGMRRLEITAANLIGIGLGIPGRVDITQNKATTMDRLKQWNGEDIADFLNQEIGVPVTVRNDIHLLAASERKFQPSHPNSFIYVARRVGIGMAVFINGKSYEGNFGNSGYIGHVVMNPDGEVCVCGKRGCLELYATTGAIEKAYRTQIGRGRCYSEILGAAEQGDATARRILQEAGKMLGTAIANTMQLFDIQTAIIGDSESDDNKYFFDIVRENIEKRVSLAEDTQLTILRGKLTSKTFALGGCLLVLNRFFKAPQLKLES